MCDKKQFKVYCGEAGGDWGCDQATWGHGVGKVLGGVLLRHFIYFVYCDTSRITYKWCQTLHHELHSSQKW